MRRLLKIILRWLPTVLRPLVAVLFLLITSFDPSPVKKTIAAAPSGCPHAGFCFLGAELVNFLPPAGLAGTIQTTNTGTFRSDYASYSLQSSCNWIGGGCGAQTSTTTTLPPTEALSTPVFDPQSDIWIHFWMSAGQITTFMNVALLSISDTGGTPRVAVVGTGNNNQAAIVTQATSGTLTRLATCSLPASLEVLNQYDIHLHYATAGNVVLYQNSTSVCSFSGDTTGGSGLTAVSQVSFMGTLNNDSGWFFWSEMAVASVDTRSLTVWDPVVQSASATQTWTGTVSDIRPPNPGDAAFIYSSAANQPSLWIFADAIPAGTWSIPVIMEQVRSLVGTTGPLNIGYAVQPAGASSPAVTASFHPTTTFSSAAPYWWTANPYTSAPWAPSDISSSLLFGVESLP